jgi:hypothetical protein
MDVSKEIGYPQIQWAFAWILEIQPARQGEQKG